MLIYIIINFDEFIKSLNIRDQLYKIINEVEEMDLNKIWQEERQREPIEDIQDDPSRALFRFKI